MNYAFTNGKILDGTKDMQVQTGLCILVQDGTITDIVPDTADLAGYKTIDLQGRYIMPGLINMHVHLAGNGKPQKKQRDNEKLVKKIMRSSLTRAIAYKMVSGFAKDELLSGVTTIRTVGGLGSFDTRLRDEIAAGTKVGPRILAANEGISYIFSVGSPTASPPMAFPSAFFEAMYSAERRRRSGYTHPCTMGKSDWL